jgi:predicted nuclease of predicted toxin-antitoxin system
VKLLYDQNLSHRLVVLLADVYPNSEHVRNLGMQSANDVAIWDRAKADDYILVTKDEDFFARSMLLGPPPLERI